MPLYEYQCNECSERFDALVSYRQAGDGVECRHCSGKDVRRLISTFATVGGYDDYSAAASTSSGGGCCGGGCGCCGGGA